MTIWPPTRGSLSRPAYQSLAQRLLRAVEAGELRPGTKLPPHRTLAFDLGVSVQTVSRAYEELNRLGVVSGQVGRGSFVLERSIETAPPWQVASHAENITDCSMLMPVTGEIHAECMSRLLREMGDEVPPAALFSFRPRQALLEHCAEARIWLEGCGVTLEGPHRILPTNGNTVAMTCALMTAAKPGDLIVTEEIGHHTLRSLASSLGLRLQGLPLDDEGILPQAFDRACAGGGVSALFVMPAGLGPTAAMMGQERRREIVAIARKHDVWIIENDALGPLQRDRPAPIVALAPERTFYFTGLAKCILPGLRLAWLVTPDAKVHAARSRHLITNWTATPLVAEMGSRLIASGVAADLLDWQRRQLDCRRRLASRMLQGALHRVSPAGMHVWLPLPDRWREEDFVRLARHNGVGVAGGSSFFVEGASSVSGVRVCLGAGSEEALEDALRVLAQIVRAEPDAALLAF